jgi:hypothetical protein
VLLLAHVVVPVPTAPVGDALERLASGWWPTLAGQDSNLLGSFVRFPLSTSSLPPHPGFAWRTVRFGHLEVSAEH